MCVQCVHFNTFTHLCLSVCTIYLHCPRYVYIPAELFGIDLGQSAWVSSQWEDWSSQMQRLGLPKISLPQACSRPKREPPSGVSSRWTPHPCWGGVYQLNGRPAVRRGIKRQVERKRISWLEWGGGKKSADTHRLADKFTLWNCLLYFLLLLLLHRNRKPCSASPCVDLIALHTISDLSFIFFESKFLPQKSISEKFHSKEIVGIFLVQDFDRTSWCMAIGRDISSIFIRELDRLPSVR